MANGDRITMFSIHFRLNIDAAAAALFASSNTQLSVSANWPENIALAYDSHASAATIEYEPAGSVGTLVPIQVSASPKGNTRVIHILVKTLNTKTGEITAGQKLTTNLIADDTAYFDLKLQGYFIT